MKRILFILTFLSALLLDYFVRATTCATGTFYYELTDQCENCFTGCSSCSGYQQKDCLDCQPSFYKIQLNSQFICAKCPSGQFYDETTSTCTACTFDCDVCLSLTKCLICKTGYIMDTSTYEKCHTTTCDTGYYRNPMTNVCIICPAASYYLECYVSKYYDAQGVLTSFTVYPTKCLETFQISSTSSCGCYTGVYLSGGKCIACTDSNCLYCSSSTTCTQCKIGYYLLNGKCVTICDQLTYYYSQISNYAYQCVKFPTVTSTSLKISYLNNEYACNLWNTYDPSYGCFSTYCRPYEFKLFNPANNSFKCVEACPVGTTGNLQTQSCIQNTCTNDITQQINGNCYHRTCGDGQYFQDFISYTTLSKCVNNSITNCLLQIDESTSCTKCKPYYFNSNCIQNCSSGNIYQQSGYCYSCTTTSCQSTYFKYKYTVNSVEYWAYNCPPEGYYLSGTNCIRCSDPNMISCDPAATPKYVCDWGLDNNDPFCAPIDLTTMAGKIFDNAGSVVTQTGACTSFDSANNLCLICASSYNYNFKGACSKQFLRPTKYYVYYNTTEAQYRVLDSCYSNQFVQRVYVGSYYMKVCKDFAVCLQTTTAIVDGVTQLICSQCPDNFYNLFGTCIDDCPTYSYKNTVTKQCENPIENCAVYYTGYTVPYCSLCKPGFIRFKSTLATSCISLVDCKDGYYYSYSNNYCIACSTGCLVCDAAKKCLQTSPGYFLYNSNAYSTCPTGTYKDTSDNTCKKCGQFCKACTDSNTCTVAYTGTQYYLVSSVVYSYTNPICTSGQYFDDTQKKCLSCNASCAQCFQSSTKCLVCTNSAYYLYNNTCVASCPTTYFKTVVATVNYSRNMCLKCDSICKDENCKTESNFCLTGCASGYSFYLSKNRCYTQCPTDYISVEGFCELSCPTGQYYDRNSDRCCGMNCKECTSTICTKCAQVNMYLDPNDNNKCITTTDTNCVQTNLNGLCTQCQTNYILDINSRCICSTPYCSQCTSTDGSICTQCQIGFYLTNTYQCCSVEFCSICSTADLSKCDTCNTNYKLNSNKQCLFDCQVANCSNCILNNTQKCQFCQTNYKLDSNSQCVFDCQVTNCTTCVLGDTQQCQTCNTNYKLDSNSQCVFDCQVSNCSTCISGNTQQCESCKSNFKLDSNKQCAFDCLVTNCTTCVLGNTQQCQTCSTNYKLDSNNQCVFDCQVSNCSACISGNTQQCESCITNYKLDQNKQCIFDCQVAHCTTCVSGNIQQCQICNSNYKLDSNNQCIFDCQVQNCTTCISGNIQQCESCITNYKLDQNKQCIFDCQVEHCITCVSRNIQQCQICNSNYKLDSNNQCIFDCQALNCTDCVQNNTQQCQICNLNYKLDPNNLCVFDCQVTNCLTCSAGNTLQCETCKLNYKLDSNNNCIPDCQLQNCLACNQSNSQQCDQCDTNYKLDSNKNCVLDCKVTNCSSCNLQDPSICLACDNNFKYDVNANSCICSIEYCNTCTKDFCEECQEGYYYETSVNQCINQIFTETNDFVIDLTLDFDQYHLLLSFQKPIIIQSSQIDLDNLIGIQITNVSENQYNYSVEQMTDKQFEIIIIPLTNMKNSEITLVIQQKQFIVQNKLSKQKETQKLQPYVKITTEEKKYSEQVAKTGKTVSESVIYILIPTILMGNAYLVCNTLDITGFLYYFPFLNIRLPYNVLSFYNIFKDFSFPFIPNMFQGLVTPGYQQVSPPKFMQFNTDNYFISNAGQSFTVVLSVFMLYVLAKLCSKTKIEYLGTYCKRAVSETWEFGGLIDLAWSFYIYIIVGIFMQLNTIDFEDENSAFINYAFHASCSMVYLGIPIVLTSLIYKNKNLKDDKNTQQKLSSMLSGLKLYNEKLLDKSIQKRNLLSKYYNCFLYARKILFCAIIVWLYDYVYVQLALFSVLNGAILLFIFLVKPFDSKIQSFQNIAQELVMFTIQICCAYLVEDDDSKTESQRIQIGWIMVSLGAFIIVWYTLFTLKDLFLAVMVQLKRMIIGFIQFAKNTFRRKKVSIVQSTYEKSSNEIKLEFQRKSLRENSRLFLQRYKTGLQFSRQLSISSSIINEGNKKGLRDSSPMLKNRDEELVNIKIEENSTHRI